MGSIRFGSRVIAILIFSALAGFAPAKAQRVPNTAWDVGIQTIPTIQALAYVSGNAIGGLSTVPAFRLVQQPGGILRSVFQEMNGGETVAITYYVFNSPPGGSTICTDKTAFVLAPSDAAKLAMPPFTLTSAAPPVGTGASFAISTFAALSLNNAESPSTVNLYVCPVGGGSFTPAVGDFKFTMNLSQD